MQRRTLIAALLAAPSLARAEGYPNRAIRMLCGFPPGGTTDIAARLVSERLSARLGVPVTVENRPGATGNIATEEGCVPCMTMQCIALLQHCAQEDQFSHLEVSCLYALTPSRQVHVRSFGACA